MPNEELEKLETEATRIEKKLTAAKHKEKAVGTQAETVDPKRKNPPTLHSCRNVGEVSARADLADGR